ncbi:PREDICTED: dickkopf-related protein 3-like [Priapulus caudatus]|uniref:Dickkopf-related protein 3-like n=1 Tax=Priapulus caudatus TaxID=37621 RepID=A0ABM1E0V3_PRICU|nr:PREDICTED: dickkopf-related protein 3-like [Priapulus caudatus]
MCRRVILLVALLAQLTSTRAYIWSWAWSNPALSQQGQPPEPTYHPRNTHLRADTASNETSEKLQLQVAYQRPCENDKACGKGKFCDHHYGTCEVHRAEASLCRRDGNCEKGLECVFGKCRPVVEHGTVGARCKHDKDCGNSQCCAKQHGEFVCKAKLQIGNKCFVPDGGIDYSLNQLCPCDRGLICRYTPQRRLREEEFDWKFWTDYDDMRCVPGI